MHVTAIDEKKEYELEKESRKIYGRAKGNDIILISKIKEITHKHKYSNQVAITY